MPTVSASHAKRADFAACNHGVRVLTPAKVNLYLAVHAELDERHYHRADSVMAALALYDEVLVTPAEALNVQLEPQVSIAAEKSNVGKAVLWLAEALGILPAVEVRVTRKIPMRAGLGGSSSDAGGTLRALCALWEIANDDPRVVSVARRIGADVPFFLNPQPSYLAGAGDELQERFSQLPATPVVLVKPEDGVSTQAAYADFDRDPVPQGNLEALLAALQARDMSAVIEKMANNLDPVACRLLPEDREAKEWLLAQNGVHGALVSGSGSCIFAPCESAETTERIAAKAKKRGWWSCATSFTAPPKVEVW